MQKTKNEWSPMEVTNLQKIKNAFFKARKWKMHFAFLTFGFSYGSPP